MKTKRNSRKSAIGIRPPLEIRELLEKIASEEKRSVPNVVVYMVDQYTSISKGKLLSNEELSNFFANQEGTPAYAEI